MTRRRCTAPCLAALALAAAAALAGCRAADGAPGDGVPTAEAPASMDHSRHLAGVDAVEPGGMSLYHVAAKWTDQHGERRELGSLAGRPQLVAMVYTNCGSACPRIVLDMKRVEREFPDVGLVLISIDPARDTPGRLAEFAAGSRLGERWTLLNGDDDALAETAAVLGVRWRRISDTDFMHSNVITLLDSHGDPIHRQEALGEVDGTLAALRTLTPPR
jgi:protein SCO1